MIRRQEADRWRREVAQLSEQLKGLSAQREASVPQSRPALAGTSSASVQTDALTVIAAEPPSPSRFETSRAAVRR